MATPPSSTPRRFPPPCWTHDETLALIDAYRHRWFALRRANLRAADWDAVAASVASAATTAAAPKSSVQCRHKMEKLRKRYRAEKQRCFSYPGRFFSSWDLFPILDSLGISSSSTVRSRHDTNVKSDDVDEFRDGDTDSLSPELGLKKTGKINGNSTRTLELDRDLGSEFNLKTLGNNSTPSGFREKKYITISNPNVDIDQFSGSFGVEIVADVISGSRGKNYVNVDKNPNPHLVIDRHFGGGFSVKAQDDRNLGPHPQGMRLKNYKKMDNISAPITDFDNNIDAFNHVGGFPVKTLGDRNVLPPGFRPKFHRLINEDLKSDMDSVPSGFRLKDNVQFGENMKPRKDFRGASGYDVSSTSTEKKSGSGGVEREMEPVMEMISSIELLAQDFVKMENMKMEMAREIEKMRMEMELKRNQMILESQQQILDAFAQALSGRKKRKGNVASINADENGNEP